MTKQFSLLQLFSLADGRLSTNMYDVCEMLNHLCGGGLFTHQLPMAMKMVEKKNPEWLVKVRKELTGLGITNETDFKEAMAIVEKNNTIYNVPQLKDSVDTEGFGDFMVDNSLLLKKFA